ncbi:MAG: carboxymuconolactone decarboxylase family protein [Chloroflexi bacterium]|nr:carboxymuconolactone decarboxylase family protein [Chloroflexota bacterium]MBA3894300.1 carboxymuconolactone decarboxylase family protein [Gemmatimonadales bacterium]
MSPTPTLTLPAHDLTSESPRTRGVLEQAKKQVGFIPNMYARMVNSPGLLETYLFGYDRFRKESGFTPAEQEVVFLTISRENGCHYCVAAHSTLADKFSGVPREVTDAIRDGDPVLDPKLRALSEFTRALLSKRGFAEQSDLQRFVAAGYREEQALEVVLAISVKTLSNWSNHLFDTPVDPMFADRAWEPAEAGAHSA